MSASVLSVFDLDHTLIRKNISFAFGSHLWKAGQLRFHSALYCTGCYFRYKVLRPCMQTLHGKVLGSFLKRLPFVGLQDHVERFLDKRLEGLLYLPAMKRLREAQERGDHVMLLSGSPDFLVGPTARRLGVKEWEATRYSVDKNDRLTTIEAFMEGGAKAKLALARAEALQVQKIHAFSDSAVDLPLLEVAGRAIGVRPERKLRIICQERGWEII
jgi:HAD superfamily hydrolase (TIGR01490 family)